MTAYSTEFDGIKFHLVGPKVSGPWGGGNQFLKALSEEFSRTGHLANSLQEADVVLVNSHHWQGNLLRILWWRMWNRGRIVLHRVDGPLGLTRGMSLGLRLDKKIGRFSRWLADGTIFQSDWSRRAAGALFGNSTRTTTISNAPEPRYFYPSDKKPKSSQFRVCATSWSANPRKGFQTLSRIAATLGKEGYSFNFAGNIPSEGLEGWKVQPPLDSEKLGSFLRECNLYIAASQDDPCSNALIEARHCGLWAIALNSGGHPELVGANFLFDSAESAAELIRKIRLGEIAHDNSPVKDISRVAEDYLAFAREVKSDK